MDSVDALTQEYYGFLWSLLTPPWDFPHFTVYFYIGLGRGITLRQIGHLEKAIDVAEKNVYPRTELYFKAQAAKAKTGPFRETFNNSYDFSDVNYVHGDSRIDGEFIGEIIEKNGKRIMSGKVYYAFSDRFEDPVDIVEALEKIPGVKKDKIPTLIKILANFLGIPYPVTDKWVEEVSFEL